MKKLIYSLFCCLFILSAHAQWKWHNPMDAGFPVVQNQGFVNEIGKTYTRLPERVKEDVNKTLWGLSQHSSGLAIHFYSNAPKIQVRYKVTGKNYSMPHMPSTGVSGVDLYQINCDGQAAFCFGTYSFKDTIVYTYNNIKKDKYHNYGYEYRLYLPLYNGVQWLEIGTPEDAKFEFIPLIDEKPIVVYGTSIAQGACASRPAMAWTSIFQRAVDYPLINLGFSGSGRLDPPIMNLINEIEGRLYILDCIPNLTYEHEKEIEERVYNAVKLLRSKHDTPILLVEHGGYSNGGSDTISYQKYVTANKRSRAAYEKIISENIPGVYYLTKEEINLSPDSRVDYVHASDLGMKQQADAVEKKAREILHIPVGTISTTRPVTQRREPGSYEWLKRHHFMKRTAQERQPKAVIIGNSITHYWGDNNEKCKNGEQTWNQKMKPAGFHNLGCGWDRIENVLWRIYHDELDGYKTDKVVLMIGTNNFGYNTNAEIVEGLRFLLGAIRQRQPQAEITVLGIYPRRKMEQRVKDINIQIRQMAEIEGFRFKDPGLNLLQPDGKIDEGLFTDGLHPNEKGYQKLVDEILR
jgi:lysophospholipase L1-like esterase